MEYQGSGGLLVALLDHEFEQEFRGEVGAVVPDDGSQNRIVPRGGEHDWVTEGFKDFAVEFA